MGDTIGWVIRSTWEHDGELGPSYLHISDSIPWWSKKKGAHRWASRAAAEKYRHDNEISWGAVRKLVNRVSKSIIDGRDATGWRDMYNVERIIANEHLAARNDYDGERNRLNVILARISGILVDAGDVNVDPVSDGVATLLKQRDKARKDALSAADLALSLKDQLAGTESVVNSAISVLRVLL